MPQGPWTPKLLADALSQIEDSRSTIDLRSVQRWFRDDDRGIKADNIRWLAWIFGCGDPEYISKWQAELSRAQSRLEAKRREKRSSKEGSDSEEDKRIVASQVASVGLNSESTKPQRKFCLAQITEEIFSRGSPLNLASSVFAGAVALGFSSYFLGIHNVTISSEVDQIKQVGFLWAPNWTLLFMAFMPLFFVFVAELIVYWKDEGRSHLSTQYNCTEESDVWERSIRALTYTFWAVFLVCLIFAGGLQWVGVRLLPLLNGGGNYATDWGSVAIMRPEVISVPMEIAFTGLAYLYMCVSFYLFFAGLILLYSVVCDFKSIQSAGSATVYEENFPNMIDVVGLRVMIAIFRCTILGILIATCMKLQSTYLASSGGNIVSWLADDMALVLGMGSEHHKLAKYSAPNHFSSLLIVLAALFVFLNGLYRVRVASPLRMVSSMMMVAIALLVFSYLLIGAFAGFSILLAVGVLVAICGLINPTFSRWNVNNMGGNRIV